VCRRLGGTKGAQYMQETNFFYGKGNENQLGSGFFVHRWIASAVKRIEFVDNRMSYTVPMGRWSNIIVLSVNAPIEKKSDDSRGSFYEELEEVLIISLSKM
jgi:hypothetical protein